MRKKEWSQGARVMGAISIHRRSGHNKREEEEIKTTINISKLRQ